MLLPFIFLVLLVGGAALAAQSSINGRLGANVGVLESAWLTFASGALVTFLLMFFFEPAHSETLFTVPKWQLIGALFGVVYMLVIVFAVPRVGTAAATDRGPEGCAPTATPRRPPSSQRRPTRLCSAAKWS